MQKRFMCLWFRHLLTDWFTIRNPELKGLPLVLVTPDHGRMVITACNLIAKEQGIHIGMVAADAKAIISDLEFKDDIPGKAVKLLNALGEWCIRYTPVIAIDNPHGLIMDVSGCSHLWGGEKEYLKEIVNRLRSKGYDVRGAIADTVGAAWATAHFGQITPIIPNGEHPKSILPLPPDALRLEPLILERLRKLGLCTINSFIRMQRSALRRRFGQSLLLRIDQALGNEDEPLQLIQPIEPYQDRLPCLEPIRTATGIEIAIKKLLESLCYRLREEGKGLRIAVLKCYRIDGKMVQVGIGTNSPTYHINHLFKLFELKIADIEPALGIELFIMEAQKVEEVSAEQEALWKGNPDLEDTAITELLDRLAGKVGNNVIHRYLPVEHYWPERSIKLATSIKDKPTTQWRNDKPRPVYLLTVPEHIEVTAPIPDYPPMVFLYRGKRHQVKKADGPERIEREWWLDEGEHRDYYVVEDENGQRYWLFRSGHYTGDAMKQWFIHGFFA